MTERSRPPGLDTVAEEGLRLGARVAIGLLAVPLIGLALLARRSPERDREPCPSASGSAMPVTTPEADGVDGSGPPAASDGPARDEVETALRKLTEATIGKPDKGKKRTAGLRAKAPGAEAAKAPSAKGAVRVRIRPSGLPDERSSP